MVYIVATTKPGRRFGVVGELMPDYNNPTFSVYMGKGIFGNVMLNTTNDVVKGSESTFDNLISFEDRKDAEYIASYMAPGSAIICLPMENMLSMACITHNRLYLLLKEKMA